MDKKEMLEAIISHYANGNKSKMARILGITPQSISTWLARNTFDNELIYSKCECINPSWLLTGHGDMIINNGITVCGKNSDNGIPLIPISAMAGALVGEQSIMDEECERFNVPSFKGADFMIPVKGDSMTPTYQSGDIVACKRVPMSDLFFQWNKVYVIDTNQGALIKRIKRGSTPDRVMIFSDNTSYDPFELPISDIYAVALVIGMIRSE